MTVFEMQVNQCVPLKETDQSNWKGLKQKLKCIFANKPLQNSLLQKTLEMVTVSESHRFEIREDAFNILEDKLSKLTVKMLYKQPIPVSKYDIERRVNLTFPSPIGAKTKDYTEKVLKHRKKPELALPVDKVHNMLKSEVLQNSKLDLEVSRYLTAILEYISMEILKLAVHYVIKIPHHCITRQDIKAAISIDKVRHNPLV